MKTKYNYGGYTHNVDKIYMVEKIIRNSKKTFFTQCVFINADFTDFDFDFGLSELIFRNCTFITCKHINEKKTPDCFKHCTFINCTA